MDLNLLREAFVAFKMTGGPAAYITLITSSLINLMIESKKKYGDIHRQTLAHCEVCSSSSIHSNPAADSSRPYGSLVFADLKGIDLFQCNECSPETSST